MLSAALKNKRFLVFGGAAALCVLFLLVTVGLQIKKHHQLSAEHNAATQELADLKAAVERVDVETLRTENQRLEDELRRIERELPENEFVPTMLDDVDSLVVTTGNIIRDTRRQNMVTGLKAGAPAEAEAEAEPAPAAGAEEEEDDGLTYGAQGIDFTLRGNYRTAFDFLQQLPTLGKILAVDSVQIDKAGPDAVWDGHAEANIQLKMRALILPPQSGFPGEVSVKVY